MASTVIPLSDRPLAERAFIALNRRANAQRRYPVVLLDEDMEALDGSTGSRRRSHDALRQLTADGRLRQVRRGAYVLGAPTGGSDARLLAILDAVTPRPYLVTAGRALAETGLSDHISSVSSSWRRAAWPNGTGRASRSTTSNRPLTGFGASLVLMGRRSRVRSERFSIALQTAGSASASRRQQRQLTVR